MSNPVISATDLTKVFSDFWGRNKVRAVSNLNIAIPQGRIYGLLGPNGSGKSTIMKLILGLLHPTSGNISVMGKSPKHVATRRLIGYLPEESQLYQHLTATETLHFYGKLFGIKKSELHLRTEQLIEMVGLSHAADRPIEKFSKGMTRRIGLAQALINDPDLLILDEPTAGLDPIGCRQVKDLLKALSNRGKTVVISSHLLADMEDVCDRIMLLHNGYSLAEGNISDLLTKENSIRFTFNDISSQQLKTINSAINTIKEIRPEIDTPQTDLENFFIKTISNAAKENSQAPSGVTGTTKLAPFIEKS
jgi:ABC-2 type transport system ATP-binding protein